MAEERLSIDVPGSGPISAIRTAPEGRASRWTFVYAPGAGSNVHDPFGTFACRALAAKGIVSTRFQFPYMEAKRRSPDRTPVLEATWNAVIETSRRPRKRLIVGGRSMGGRIGSHVVAQGTKAAALALFAYPLHPPGKPEQRRDAHLPEIAVPTLFCSGTRDPFASAEELRAAATLVPNASVHALDGADHGFAVPKSSGQTRQDVWAEAVDALLVWLRTI